MSNPMYFRQFLKDDTACASYLFGCKTAGKFAVVDAHADLVDDYIAAAASQGSEIVAVLETHIQADHVSGLPELVERTGATPYMPVGSGAGFEHDPLANAARVKLGNTVIEAIATPGHAPAHHAYLVTDHRRGDEPWFVLTGDSLLVGDVGRPDLHAMGEDAAEQMARILYRSVHEGLLTLPDHLLVYPAHYAGSVCGRGLSGHPASTIGFERHHNEVLAGGSEDAFVEAVLKDIPPVPERQAEIVAANRSGEPSAAHA
jgi:hydroxyacylglutathione hydrolase